MAIRAQATFTEIKEALDDQSQRINRVITSASAIGQQLLDLVSALNAINTDYTGIDTALANLKAARPSSTAVNDLLDLRANIEENRVAYVTWINDVRTAAGAVSRPSN